MRSFSSRLAFSVNSVGGIHGMSRWQSAEILRYCMANSHSAKDRDRIDCTPANAGSPSGGAPYALLFCRRDMNRTHPCCGGLYGLRLHAICGTKPISTTKGRTICARLPSSLLLLFLCCRRPPSPRHPSKPRLSQARLLRPRHRPLPAASLGSNLSNGPNSARPDAQRRNSTEWTPITTASSTRPKCALGAASILAAPGHDRTSLRRNNSQ